MPTVIVHSEVLHFIAIVTAYACMGSAAASLALWERDLAFVHLGTFSIATTGSIFS